MPDVDRAVLVIDVPWCPRCDGEHQRLEFVKLGRAIDVGSGWALGYWAPCPETGEPILAGDRSEGDVPVSVRATGKRPGDDAARLARSVLATRNPTDSPLWRSWALDLAGAIVTAEREEGR